jgi:hypothetical protein
MAGILEFNQFIGGLDNIKIEQFFPSTQKTFVYNFAQDVTGWTFNLDHQTIIVDTITYDRNSGAPNFANSQVIGTFPAGQISTATNVTVVNTASGVVAVTIPGGLYTGPILPDARTHNPFTVVGVTWTDNSTPKQVNTHRWGLLQCWESGVTPADPILSDDYTPITIGA